MKRDYSQYRAAGTRSQVSTRRSAAPVATAASDRVPYQLTPQASKDNAFCWMSWEPQIQWRGTKDEIDAQAKRNRIMDEKRAEGIDPLYMRGLGENTRRDPMQFSTLSWRTRPIDAAQASRTETLRAALKSLGPQSAAALATVTHLENSGLVGALLKNDIAKGRVTLHEGEYAWLGE